MLIWRFTVFPKFAKLGFQPDRVESGVNLRLSWPWPTAISGVQEGSCSNLQFFDSSGEAPVQVAFQYTFLRLRVALVRRVDFIALLSCLQVMWLLTGCLHAENQINCEAPGHFPIQSVRGAWSCPRRRIGIETRQSERRERMGSETCCEFPLKMDRILETPRR